MPDPRAREGRWTLAQILPPRRAKTAETLRLVATDGHRLSPHQAGCIEGETRVRVRLLRADPSWSYGDGKTPEESLWPHAKAFLAIESVKVRRGELVERDERMFVSSYDPTRLTPAQWLLLVRSHWGVENNNHHTFDTAFVEDGRPWSEADADGMLAVLVLRRIAYTLLTLFRAAPRTEDGRATRWRALLTRVRDVLVAATEDQLAGLREIAAATR